MKLQRFAQKEALQFFVDKAERIKYD